MNTYIIEVNNQVAGKALIAANDYNEAGRIFNDLYRFVTNNPIKDWNYNISLSDILQTNVNSPQVLLDCIY
mgnify:CR=1 FL=1